MKKRKIPSFLTRIAVCAGVLVVLLLAFYISLLASSRGLNIEQKHLVRRATALIRERGFTDEALLLELAVYRSDDHWLNSSVAKENAYAATNFPFEIMTLYPDFFAYPADEVERAAILLHEARHLMGKDEADAYAFVWKNRKVLGWTRERYMSSPVWINIRGQTKDHVPELFSCGGAELGDCTE